MVDTTSSMNSVEELYREAIEKWGKQAQMDMIIEECAELIQKIAHYRRFKATKEEVIDELADVQIMIEQAELLFGPIAFAREKKLKRLQQKLGRADLGD